MEKKNIKFDIEGLCISLIAVNRFYATILSKIVKQPFSPELIKQLEASNQPVTAAVGFNQHGKITLHYNDEWLMSMSLCEAQGVIIHEVLHVFFRHQSRLPMLKGDSTNQIKNIACDMAINQYIASLPKLPNGGTACYPEQQNFPKDKSAEWYYDALRKKSEQQQEKVTLNAGSLDSHELWDKIINDGDKIEGTAKEKGIDADFEVNQVVMKSIAECKDYGKLPAFVEKELKALKEEKRHDWKHTLRVFVNSVLTTKRRLSQKRVNRRFSELDYFLPGKKKCRKPRILAVRDTSGSVFDDKIQNEFLNELIQISKRTDMMVADCDTEINQTYKVRKVKDFKKCRGGGGTSFKPVFEYALQENFDGIIYFTDTYGDFPTVDEARKFAHKTVWVTIDQDKVELPFGKHLNIDSKLDGKQDDF